MRFIGRSLWLLVTIAAMVVGMVFATSNSGTITLHLWPLASGLSLPVWLSVLGALSIGVLIGALLVWLSTVAIRARNWRLEQQVRKLERRAADAETQLADAKSHPAITAPKAPH